MTITAQQLLGCMPDAGERVVAFIEALNGAMQEFEISTLQRKAMFLAQIAHESQSLKYTREIWGPTPAQLRYEGNLELGNSSPGDGKRFLGRGLIQITGRSNYEAARFGLKHDVINDMEYLELPIGACRSAGWFFKTRGCNVAADLGNFWTVSKIVNGGTNGLDDRFKHYLRSRKVFNL